MNTFIERDCTVELQGKKLPAGGAWIADCTDGYRRGVVYVQKAQRWDGCGFCTW